MAKVDVSNLEHCDHGRPRVACGECFDETHQTLNSPARAGRPGDTQEMPQHNGERDIQSQVIEDIIRRREVGIERYGTALQPFNGRSGLLDLYEELLDATMYVKQVIVEQANGTRTAVEAVLRPRLADLYDLMIDPAHEPDIIKPFEEIVDEITSATVEAIRASSLHGDEPDSRPAVPLPSDD